MLPRSSRRTTCMKLLKMVLRATLYNDEGGRTSASGDVSIGKRHPRKQKEQNQPHLRSLQCAPECLLGACSGIQPQPPAGDNFEIAYGLWPNGLCEVSGFQGAGLDLGRPGSKTSDPLEGSEPSQLPGSQTRGGPSGQPGQTGGVWHTASSPHLPIWPQEG